MIHAPAEVARNTRSVAEGNPTTNGSASAGERSIMKALSLRPEWAMPVLLGWKTIECRTWKTDYRGDLLICSSSRPCACAIARHALCIVSLDKIEPFTGRHLDDACMDIVPKNAYAWHLSNLRWIEPFEVKGKLHIYDVPDDLIKEIPESISNVDALRTYYEPLVKWGDREMSESEARAVWADILADF